jgi:two-component system sensor histidine kinase KdpD
VDSKRHIAIARWFASALCLAGIVAFYRLAVRVNPTTIALTLLVLILFLAANWGLRYAIVTSIAATACYNFFFLPPIGTFTVADPQNVVALIVFLITSVFASRLSDRIRSESTQVRARQAELEVLYSLSRNLLQTDELTRLTNSIPSSVALAAGANSVLFYLLQGDKIYLAGAGWPAQPSTPELHQLSQAPGISFSAERQEAIVPLRTGVQPRGVLILRGVRLSNQTLEALGGLVSISLVRAHAIEEVTRTEAAKESEWLRDLMLDSITHDLRTPISSIKAAVSTLLTSVLPPHSTQELLTLIDEESGLLNQLVAQAVEMAQLDTQEINMSFSPQEVKPMIDAAIKANAARLAGREVTVRLAPGLPKVDADPAWIEKLLGYLLENATRYSGAGQPIFLSAELRGSFLACSVADRGIGIDPAEQSLIFEKFYRSRKRGTLTTGTGMGLAICRAIAEAHGGAIGVTSQPGHGSVFTFTLPLHARAAA